jgi:ribose/xylose/arabinose/galactoside ABC-type transport system permease subunit
LLYFDHPANPGPESILAPLDLNPAARFSNSKPSRALLHDTLSGALRPWLSLALVCAGFSLNSTFRTTFWTPSFLQTVLQQAATNIILAVGMTFVILTAGIDLSIGSVLALSGIALGMTVKTGPAPFLAWIMALPLGVLAAALAARLLRTSLPVCAAIGAAVTGVAGFIVQQATQGGIQLEGAILAALAVGCGCGLMNGLAVTVGRVPPFVVTLGMYTAARGLTVYATDGNSVSGLPHRLGALGQGPVMLAIAAVVVAAGAVILAKTRFGRYLYSIGGNEEAARLTGVNVGLYKTVAYTLSGIAAAIAAVVLTAKFQVADTGAAAGAELNAIAAVVIGGARLSGGYGSVIGTLVGALTIAVLNAGLVLAGVRDTLQGVVIGGVIVLTVMIDQIRRR